LVLPIEAFPRTSTVIVESDGTSIAVPTSIAEAAVCPTVQIVAFNSREKEWGSPRLLQSNSCLPIVDVQSSIVNNAFFVAVARSAESGAVIETYHRDPGTTVFRSMETIRFEGTFSHFQLIEDTNSLHILLSGLVRTSTSGTWRQGLRVPGVGCVARQFTLTSSTSRWRSGTLLPNEKLENACDMWLQSVDGRLNVLTVANPAQGLTRSDGVSGINVLSIQGLQKNSSTAFRSSPLNKKCVLAAWIDGSNTVQHHVKASGGCIGGERFTPVNVATSEGMRQSDQTFQPPVNLGCRGSVNTCYVTFDILKPKNDTGYGCAKIRVEPNGELVSSSCENAGFSPMRILATDDGVFGFSFDAKRGALMGRQLD
jgi:hypothetical protein